MVLRQSIESLRNDVVYAQRSAMLLKRDSGDPYIRGILVDLRGLRNPVDPDGRPTYSMNKWCSSGYSYVEFSPDNIPATIPKQDCNASTLGLMGKQDVFLAGGTVDVCITRADQSATNVAAIVFESVNGQIHFYRVQGSGSGSRFILLPAVEDVRVAVYRGNRWNALIIHKDGQIEYERWNPDDPDPCNK